MEWPQNHDARRGGADASGIRNIGQKGPFCGANVTENAQRTFYIKGKVCLDGNTEF